MLKRTASPPNPVISTVVFISRSKSNRVMPPARAGRAPKRRNEVTKEFKQSKHWRPFGNAQKDYGTNEIHSRAFRRKPSPWSTKYLQSQQEKNETQKAQGGIKVQPVPMPSSRVIMSSTQGPTKAVIQKTPCLIEGLKVLSTYKHRKFPIAYSPYKSRHDVQNTIMTPWAETKHFRSEQSILRSNSKYGRLAQIW